MRLSLQPESKFFGLTGRLTLSGHDLRLLIPTTFMNRSGKSVAAMARFFKIAPENILIAHDELDIPPGTARFKQGGGHGGHNGLRDIVPALGNNRTFTVCVSALATRARVQGDRLCAGAPSQATASASTRASMKRSPPCPCCWMVIAPRP